jgi:hypothetical protein
VRRAAWVALSIVAFLGVLGVLYLLIGNLAGMELQSAVSTPVETPDRGDPAPLAASEGEPRAVAPVQIALRVLIILAILVLVLGTLLSRSFRRDFLQRVVVTGVTLVFMILFAVLLVNRAGIEPSDEDAQTYVDETPVAAATAEEDGSSSQVALALAILVGATVLAGAGWVTTRLLARRQRQLESPDVLREIAEAARTASRRLRDGDPLSRVVLDCYAEMSQLLAQEEHVTYDDYLTPREFAQRLRARGMESEHAERLTQIFEVVRYGGRSDARLADEALDCLTSVRDRYAMGLS